LATPEVGRTFLLMARTETEDPGRSPAAQLEGVEYPVWRDTLVRTAEDNGATVDVINLFKSLPRGKYESQEEVERDFAEAARRMAMGGAEEDDGVDRDRRNLGRDLVESAPPGHTRHP
jgi:hypothetical protein